MKITSSDVAFNAQQSKESNEKYSKTQTNFTSSQNTNLNLSGITAEVLMTDVVELSYKAKIRSEHSNNVLSKSQVKNISTDNSLVNDSSTASYEQHHATHSVVQKTIGVNATVQNLKIAPNTVSLIDPVSTQAYKNINKLSHSQTNSATNSLSINQGAIAQQARLEIKEQYSFSEEERLHVGTQGRVTTADGREIDFMLQLDMHRDFTIEESLHIENSQRQLMDPMVINLDGGAASLTSSSFSFDLNADGINEQISFVGQGSGFLAIDKNQDGKINNGSELFGTKQNNAFADLAQYDNDNNKWIDENDEIYSKLKIWTKDDVGNDHLVSLKDAGVGAIYLGSSVASFDLTDSENNLLGQVKRSGIYLTEKGEVASIQELDIAIQSPVNNSVSSTHINQSLNDINNQIDEWQEQTQSSNNQLLDLNFATTPDQGFEEDEDKLPTLLDLLFPKPTRQQNNNHQVNKFSHTEEASSVNIKRNDQAASEEKLEENQPVFEVDKNSFDMLQRLEQKSAEKHQIEEEKYNHLKAIIESLVKKAAGEKQINKS